MQGWKSSRDAPPAVITGDNASAVGVNDEVMETDNTGDAAGDNGDAAGDGADGEGSGEVDGEGSGEVESVTEDVAGKKRKLSVEKPKKTKKSKKAKKVKAKSTATPRKSKRAPHPKKNMDDSDD